METNINEQLTSLLEENGELEPKPKKKVKMSDEDDEGESS